VFGVKKFHSYLLWPQVYVDHGSPAIGLIFGPKTGVPPLSAAQMQRWSLILAAYQYEIEYSRSAEHANSDALSSLVSSSADNGLDVDEYLISYVNKPLGLCFNINVMYSMFASIVTYVVVMSDELYGFFSAL